ncbi:MAG: hypothetical protein Q7R71_00325 [bacterium]|nr:hypothetical protein [bacterium]
MQSSLKWVGGVLVLLVLVIVGGYLAGKQKAVSESSDVATVIGTSIVFGQSLHQVSLQAPLSDFAVEVEQAYSRYVSPELIQQWKQNPASAPGQKTSSPWPQGIEVITADKQTDGSYIVTGNVVEVTSEEVSSGGYSNKYPVTLTLQKIKGIWLITGYQAGSGATL